MILNLRQDGSPQGGDGLPAPFTTARPDARSKNGNGQKTENGRIRMDYMRLSGKPRQQGGDQSRDG